MNTSETPAPLIQHRRKDTGIIRREETMACNPKLRILLVDDSSTMRRLIRKILRQLGFVNIVEADDGTTAWEMLQKEEIEFIVSDWNMPKMKGIDLLRQVRASEKYSEIPFLMVTGEAQEKNVLEAVEAKVSNYIVKPFNEYTLQKKIDKIFGTEE